MIHYIYSSSIYIYRYAYILYLTLLHCTYKYGGNMHWLSHTQDTYILHHSVSDVRLHPSQRSKAAFVAVAVTCSCRSLQRRSCVRVRQRTQARGKGWLNDLKMEKQKNQSTQTRL